MMTRRSQQKFRRWMFGVSALVVGLTAVTAFAGTAGLLPLSVKPSQGDCVVDSNAQINCQLGGLPKGSSATILVAYAAPTAGQLLNTASVKGNEPDPNKSNNTDTENTTVLGMTDLSVTKTDSPDPVLVGKNVTYTIKAVNNGPSVATGVIVTDTLPSGVKFVSASSTAGSCTQNGAGDVVCYIGTMLANSPVTITLVVATTEAGTIVNQVCIAGNEKDPKPGNNIAKEPTTVRNPVVDLSINKKDDADPVYVGDTVTYTITVINNGPDDASGVNVMDLLTQK